MNILDQRKTSFEEAKRQFEYGGKELQRLCDKSSTAKQRRAVSQAVAIAAKAVRHVGQVYALCLLLALMLASPAVGAFQKRNCDINEVPFKEILDINKVYDPQFTGWGQAWTGQALDFAIPLGTYGPIDPNATYVIEFTDLPPGILCISSNPPSVPQPRLAGIFLKPGLYYTHYWAHRAGSTIRTDFNQGTIIFNVEDAVYVELMCNITILDE